MAVIIKPNQQELVDVYIDGECVAQGITKQLALDAYYVDEILE